MENAKSEVRTKKRKRRQSFFCSAFFILCLLFLFGIVRLYVIESLHISTDSMETTLHKGDFVLVNKFPFGNKPERRDIVLFTSPLRKDSLAAPLLISRCIGIAGDTIRVNANGYRINGEEYPHSPNTLNTYFMPNEGKAILIASVKKLHIPLRDFKEERDGFTLALTFFEEYQIRDELPDAFKSMLHIRPIPPYQFVIPQKNRAYKLDSLSLLACREAILNETNGKAVIWEGKLYMEGKQTDFFFFQQDYYWFLSDNRVDAIDSRHLGVIPSDCLEGKLFFCWFSSDKEKRFSIL